MPQVHPEIWKKIIDDPGLCDPYSKTFRNKLPAESKEIAEMESNEQVIGLLFKH
jgi:hypothetical protein